jgi:hypothetical protein
MIEQTRSNVTSLAVVAGGFDRVTAILQSVDGVIPIA